MKFLVFTYMTYNTNSINTYITVFYLFIIFPAIQVVGCEIDTSSESVQHSNGGLDGFDPFKIEEEDPVKSDAMSMF